MKDDGTYDRLPNPGMERVFHFEYTLISCKGVHDIKEDRTLQIADHVMIDGIAYRIQEEPEDGVIWVVKCDPSLKDYTMYMKHENDVESVIWSTYEEY